MIEELQPFFKVPKGIDPRCFTFGSIGVGSAIALGLSAVSTGVGAAAATGAFSPTLSQPNLASSSKALSDTQANLLPIERGMASAALAGGKFTFSLPAGVDGSQYGFNTLAGGQGQQVFIPSPNGGAFGTPTGQWVNYDPKDFQPGGQYAGISNPQTRNVSTDGKGNYTVDFTGYGAGDVQSKIAEQSAAGQLKNAQQYDPQLIAASLKEAQLADPQSFAARQLENQLIQQQITNPPENPVANTLSDQVDQQVKAGKGLDQFDTDTLNKAVSDALASRGGTQTNGADFSQPLTTGAAGVARQAAGIQKGVGELSSGTSPEDIQYRQEQQNLANLSALVNGSTPITEFKSLSGAQTGPAPYVSGSPSPTIPSGGSVPAGNAAITASGITNNFNASQTNPWIGGLSALLSGAGAASQLGFKPFASPGPN